MNKRITLTPHLKLEALETRYRKAKDAVARSQWQIIWLLAQEKTTQDIAEVTGYSCRWIRQLARRYNQGGPEAMGDRRHENAGGQCILSAAQQQQLQELLDDPPSDGGLWTGPKGAAWITEQVGHQIPPQRGWEYLKRFNYSKRVLRPRHAKADSEQQEAFKKPFLNR